MSVIAVVTKTRDGAHVRLSNYGFRFVSIPLGLQLGEEPTDAAARALAEHGWIVTEAWDQSAGDEWLARVELVDKPTATNSTR